jgi:hypothetical protein
MAAAMEFRCPCGTECLRSVSASRGQNHPPPPDLGIPVSYHLKPRIKRTTHTPSTQPALTFRWPSGTESLRSVSASRGHNHPPQPDLSNLASYHRNTHIHTNLYTPSPTRALHFRWPSSTERTHICLSGSKPHSPISASRPPTAPTSISAPTYISPV